MNGASPVAIVTGGSGGIGLQTALALRARGCTVYTLSRRGAETPGITHLRCDVSDEAAVRAAVDDVCAHAGRVDILINNAGFGISGAAEFTETVQAKRLLDVNLFGAVNCSRAVLPVMRAQGGGCIVNISSVAAPCAIPFQSWYSVSKAAVSTYSAALRNEVRPFGVRVCAVLPGDIRSDFTAARQKNMEGDGVYAGRIARSVAVMEHDEETGMDPADAGAYIARIALRRHPKPEYVIGGKYRVFTLLARLLPCRMEYWIIGLMYAR